jgi:hypothetical protein
MQNSYFGPECTISGYQSCEASILVHCTQNDVCECFRWFTNLRHEQDAKLLFEPGCTILGYQSCEASILVHCTQNDVCECFRWFTNLRHEQDAKLLFEPKCTISGYQSCEASILVHRTQNDVWKCFGAFRKPTAGKRWKTRVSGPNAIFRGTKVVKHPF